MKRILISLIFACIVGTTHLALFTSPWGDRIELVLVDLWFSLRGPIEAPKDVVILSMDEASYKNLEIPMDQAWPRALHAKMLTRLKELGAKRAVMDILFIGPSTNQEADSALEDAIRGIPTVLGVDTGFREQGQGAGKYAIEELLTPYEPFSYVAEKLALPKMPEKDGVIREFVIPRSHITQDIPTLYEAAAGVNHGEAGIPALRDLVWYYGPPGAIPTYPYYQVFETEHPLPPETFKDKIVFVGLNLRTGTGPMEKDSFKIPFRERPMFGVEIQATAAANVLNNQWVVRFSEWRESAFLFLFTILCSIVICSVRPVKGFFLLVVLSAGWLALSYGAFLSGIFIPGILLVGGALPTIYLISTLAYYFITYRSQQAVERAFSLYLPKEMAKEMGKNKKGLQLGGESINATALFTDIAGFTELAEGMTALEVSQMLNAYFTDIIRVVFTHQGTVIKFIGDAVFVIWGAPIACDDHGKRAVHGACAIRTAVALFNANKKFPKLHTRIGINTGQMVVGNLGSAERFDYTAIGDAVNLAARLEGLNKYFGTTILISESTKENLAETIPTRCLGKIRAVGKSESVQIYTILEKPHAEEEAQWHTALTHFQERRFTEAHEIFDTLANQSIELHKAAALYLKEITHLTTDGIPETWHGEITFSQK
jgi:adenylate cyclase